MILLVCVDDDMGMLFNKRRQSQDRLLRQYILEMTADSRLWLNNYSAQQFKSETAPQLCIDENYLQKAAPGDYCLAEDADVSMYEQQVEKLILFKWNRRYPADLYLGIELANWRLIEVQEFQGSSHEKITKEVYVR